MTSERQAAADHHGRDRAEQGGGAAGHEGAEFVGGADEDRLDGDHAAAQRIGRGQRHQCAADIDADHVGGAEHEHGQEREPVVLRQAEDDGRHAEDADRDEQARADMALERLQGQHGRGGDGAQSLRAAQQPAGVGADPQDILGEDRDERGGAGEQDGEQVERDGAQQQLVAEDERQPGEHRSEVAIGARHLCWPCGATSRPRMRKMAAAAPTSPSVVAP